MEKVSLPIKTKIAAWWIMIIGGISLGIFVFVLLNQRGITINGKPALVNPFFIYLLSFLGINFLFLPIGFFLLRRRGWAWKFAILIFSLVVIAFIIPYFLFALLLLLPLAAGLGGGISPSPLVGFYLPFLFFLPPFILLLLDRKNFWKITI